MKRFHCHHRAWAALLVSAVTGVALPHPAVAGGAPQGGGPAVTGPLLVIDQQGIRSQQVQEGAGHDELVAVQGGAVRVLAQGLTVTCCGLAGLASSPSGPAIAFSQEPLATSATRTEGLWLLPRAGTAPYRLLLPPAPATPAEPLSISAVSWAPDGATLA